MSGIEEILESILSPDNTVRKEAEQALENANSQDPAKLMEELFSSMSNPKDNVANLS